MRDAGWKVEERSAGGGGGSGEGKGAVARLVIRRTFGTLLCTVSRNDSSLRVRACSFACSFLECCVFVVRSIRQARRAGLRVGARRVAAAAGPRERSARPGVVGARVSTRRNDPNCKVTSVKACGSRGRFGRFIIKPTGE